MFMYCFCILMLTHPIKIKIHLVQDKALCVSGKPAVKAVYYKHETKSTQCQNLILPLVLACLIPASLAKTLLHFRNVGCHLC